MRALDLEVDAVLGPKGALSQALPGYESRPAQIAFAKAVAEAIQNTRHLVAEVGTGTGKSFAYLVPALLSGKRVLVATADRSLQEQLSQRDLPLLLQVLAPTLGHVQVAVLKGRANYLCLYRTGEVFASEEMFQAAGAGSRQVQELARWAKKTEDGDLDRYPGELGSLRARIVSNSESCLGPSCPEAEWCFANLARQRASSARLVITNQTLLLLDCDMRYRSGGAIGVLPPADAVVVDEAHHLEETAQEAFGLRISTRGLERLIDEATSWLGTKVLDRVRELKDDLERDLQQVIGDRATALLPEAAPWRESAGKLASAFQDIAQVMATGLNEDNSAQALVGKTVANRLANRAFELRGFLAPDPSQWADWLERTSTGSITMRRTAIQIGPLLQQRLFATGAPVVLCSATLATSSGLGWYREQVGCPESATELELPSPFPYPRLARLYLPDRPHELDPQRAGETTFLDNAAVQIVQLVRAAGGGAFVLCSSGSLLEELKKRITPVLAGETAVFAHGELERPELLRRFRENGNALLLGLRSFWEGVDVPGSALRLVIIPRLPFAPPDDPVYAARAKVLGRDAFYQLALPAAELQVRQGFGRLIRRATDRGVVAILDGRVQTRAYGQHILRALPRLPVVRSFDEVRDFLTRSS